MMARRRPLTRSVVFLAVLGALAIYLNVVGSLATEIGTLRDGLVIKGQQLHELTAKVARLAVLQRELGGEESSGPLDLLSEARAVLARLGLQDRCLAKEVPADQQSSHLRCTAVDLAGQGLVPDQLIGLIQELMALSRFVRIESLDLVRQDQGGLIDMKLRISILQPARSSAPNKKGLYLEDTGPKHVEPKAAIRGISRDHSSTGLGSRPR